MDSDGRVLLVDGENFILVDQKHVNETAAPGWRVTHTSDGFGCHSSFCYSSEDLCTHHESDHNLYGVCKGILSATNLAKEMPEGLLHSPPPTVQRRHPLMQRLLAECAKPTHSGGRFEAAKELLEIFMAL